MLGILPRTLDKCQDEMPEAGNCIANLRLLQEAHPSERGGIETTVILTTLSQNISFFQPGQDSHSTEEIGRR